MNPFDRPPTGTPASLDPPSVAGHGGHDGPRRGRLALAALAAAGLVGGGVVVAGQFASADDRPSLDAAAAGDESAPPPDEPPSRSDEGPSIDGEIVIDGGDGDPIVLDLGELGACLGPILDAPMFHGDGHGDGEGRPPLAFDEDFQRRMEAFLDELPLDQLDQLDDGVRIFGSGGSTITVVGPDGVEVIDLGDGDATVTIEQSDGRLTIEADGDATVSELPVPGELDLGELDPGELELELPPLPGLDRLERCFDDLEE